MLGIEQEVFHHSEGHYKHGIAKASLTLSSTRSVFYSSEAAPLFLSIFISSYNFQKIKRKKDLVPVHFELFTYAP
jgi:hypothetical protein